MPEHSCVALVPDDSRDKHGNRCLRFTVTIARSTCARPPPLDEVEQVPTGSVQIMNVKLLDHHGPKTKSEAAQKEEVRATLLEICPRGNNKWLLLYFFVHGNCLLFML